MIINNMSNTSYYDPLLSFGLMGSYHINAKSSLFVYGSYYLFYDSYNKGNGFSLSSGYTYMIDLGNTKKESTHTN